MSSHRYLNPKGADKEVMYQLNQKYLLKMYKYVAKPHSLMVFLKF
ncbi:hypothetical protein PCA01_18180 [Pseudoalteromonas carrageenovora]|nr:hypothetical protein PCA01_18180 [Pseudoalteromonas carrageenovora]